MLSSSPIKIPVGKHIKNKIPRSSCAIPPKSFSTFGDSIRMLILHVVFRISRKPFILLKRAVPNIQTCIEQHGRGRGARATLAPMGGSGFFLEKRRPRSSGTGLPHHHSILSFLVRSRRIQKFDFFACQQDLLNMILALPDENRHLNESAPKATPN